MLGLLQRLKERKSFMEATAKAREEERARSGGRQSGPPIFNRRIFGVGSIAITATAARIMKHNERLALEYKFHLTESERLVLKNIVDSLRLIHRGRSHVKLVIANCLTHETHKAFDDLERRPHEEQFSCYYILHGSLEATYEAAVPADGGTLVSQQMFQPNIVYTHGMGEYLGLLSHGDEDQGDLAPPATLYCKTDCELLRVDRAKFHALMDSIEAQMQSETAAFLNADWNFLHRLPESEKSALAPHLTKDSLRPDSLVLKQGEKNDWIYFLTSGRCQAYRMLRFQEDGQEITETFALRTYDKGDMFGEESSLTGGESSLSVCTKSHATVYRLHRSQLTVLGRQHLCRLVRDNAGAVPTDAQLRERRSAVRTWEAFRCETAASLAECRRENLSRIKRIQSAPSSLGLTSKKRHLEFLEGEILSKISSGLPTKNAVKSSAPPAGTPASRAAAAASKSTMTTKTVAPTGAAPMATASAAGDRKLLTGTVTQFLLAAKLRGGSGSSTVDSREIQKRFANKDYENRVKQGWIFAAETQNEDLANNQYSPVDTGEFVARAKAAASEQAERVRALRLSRSAGGLGTGDQEDCEPDGLEQDRRLAATGLAFHRLRLHLLRRRLNRLDRRRTNEDETAATDAADEASNWKGLNRGANLTEKELREIGEKSRRRRNAAKFVDPGAESRSDQQPLHQQAFHPNHHHHQQQQQQQPIQSEQQQHQQQPQSAASTATERRNALQAGRLWLSAKPSGERFISMYNSRRKSSIVTGTESSDPEEIAN